MKLRAVGIAASILIMLACLRLAGVGGGGADAVMWGKAGRSKPGTFDKPRCVAVATDLTVWVLDLTGRIQHFTADGEYLGQIQMPDVSVGRPQGIDVDRHGFIYVADTHYFQIIKFDPSGKILLRFGEKGTEPGKLFWPCAIKIADDGIIYTAEYGGGHDRIQKWSPEGRYLGGWGAFGLGDGEFMRPMGLAFDSRGDLYVADAVNHRVQVFSRAGKLLRKWGGEGIMNYPYDIAIDGMDRVYTVEYGANRVQCFSSEGKLLSVWRQAERAAGGLNQPWGMDVTTDGRVYIADTYHYRVVKAGLLPGLEYSPAEVASNDRLLKKLKDGYPK